MSTTSVAVLLALLLAAIPAKIAKDKGREWFPWYVLGFFLFLPALIAAAMIKPGRTRGSRSRVLAPSEGPLTDNERRMTPMQRLVLHERAMVPPPCSNCGADIEPGWVACPECGKTLTAQT